MALRSLSSDFLEAQDETQQLWKHSIVNGHFRILDWRYLPFQDPEIPIDIVGFHICNTKNIRKVGFVDYSKVF